MKDALNREQAGQVLIWSRKGSTIVKVKILDLDDTDTTALPLKDQLDVFERKQLAI